MYNITKSIHPDKLFPIIHKEYKLHTKHVIEINSKKKEHFKK